MDLAKSPFESWVTNPLVCTFSWKFNCEDSSSDSQIITSLLYYVKSLMPYEINIKLLSSIGKHCQGDNALEHIHVNIVCPNLPTVSMKNPSRSYNRYFDENGIKKPDSLSLKYKVLEQPCLDPVQKCLSYPYKEGVPLDIDEEVRFVLPFPSSVRSFLIENGKAIYEATLQKQREKIKASEKQQSLTGRLLDLAKDMDYESMPFFLFKESLYIQYYHNLNINSYPNFQDMQKSVQKVAIFLKIVPPYHFDKSA